VFKAISSPFSQNAAVLESVVHLNFISCFKCCLRRCRRRKLLLFRHFPQSSHIKSFSGAWSDVSITVILASVHIYYFNFPVFKISSCIYFMKTKIYEVTYIFNRYIVYFSFLQDYCDGYIAPKSWCVLKWWYIIHNCRCPGGSMSSVVESNNSYKPITNTRPAL
jgi:hypothetical protein